MLKCRQINRRNWARGPLPATPEEVILVASAPQPGGGGQRLGKCWTEVYRYNTLHYSGLYISEAAVAQ